MRLGRSLRCVRSALRVSSGAACLSDCLHTRWSHWSAPELLPAACCSPAAKLRLGDHLPCGFHAELDQGVACAANPQAAAARAEGGVGKRGGAARARARAGAGRGRVAMARGGGARARVKKEDEGVGVVSEGGTEGAAVCVRVCVCVCACVCAAGRRHREEEDCHVGFVTSVRGLLRWWCSTGTRCLLAPGMTRNHTALMAHRNARGRAYPPGLSSATLTAV